MKLLLNSLLMFSLCILSFQISVAAELRSQIEVRFDRDTSRAVFKLIPNSGLIVNEDAPWKIEITEIKNAEMTKKVANREDFDLKAAEAQMSLKKSSKGLSYLKYKFIGFVCTKDKSKCFRDVHSGDLKF